MRVLLLVNPVSGRGRGTHVAAVLLAALRDAGHDAQIVQTRPDGEIAWLDERLGGCDVLAVLGGDGAVRDACAAAAGTDVAVYHVPCGTENLFARECATDAESRTLLHALDAGRTTLIDMGMVGGVPFVLMASVGFDADVIEDLATHRRGAITHRHYLTPILRQLARWHPVPLRVHVDDRCIVDGQPGLVIVANCRQYAMRLDPGLRADMTDGRLDVVFLPMRSRWDVLRWAMTVRRRRHVDRDDVPYELGRRVLIESDQPFRYQLDGERPADGRPVTHLEIEVRPAVVRVLLPDKDVPAPDPPPASGPSRAGHGRT